MDKQDQWRIELDIQWNSVGNTCSKEFFELHSKYKVKNHIKEIQHNGATIRDPQDICRIMMQYYTSLYEKDEEVDANCIARERCLQSGPAVVTQEQNQQLTKEVTLEEVKFAIENLPKSR